MSEVIKRKFNIGIGKEITRGTKVVPAVWLKPTSEDINDQVEVVPTERSMGIIEDSEDQAVTKEFASGVIAGEIFDESFGYVLLGALGKVTSVESADSGVYDHTFEILQSAQHPSVTLEIKRGDIEQLAYPNAVVENLKISALINQYAMYEVDYRAKKGETASNSPSYTTENYFLAKDVCVKMADDVAGLDGASAMDIRSIEIEEAKNVEDDDTLCEDGPSDFLNKQVVIEGSIEMNFNTVYEKNYMLNNTVRAMRITMERADVTIGATSHPKLVIDLAKVKFSEAPITGGNNDIAKVELKFKAFYSTDDAFSMKAILSNEKVSY